MKTLKKILLLLGFFLMINHEMPDLNGYEQVQQVDLSISDSDLSKVIHPSFVFLSHLPFQKK